VIDPDAGAEDGSEERHSGTANLRFVMLDDPGPFENLETWEQFLAEVGGDAGLSREGKHHRQRQVADRAEARTRREAVTGYGVRSESLY
jgi:hypothetical protein